MSKFSRSGKSSTSKNYDKDKEGNDCNPYEAEIWIYTKSSDRFTSAQDKFLNSKGYKSEEDIIESSLVPPIFQHWILVAKFRGPTLWLEANEREKVLQADILDFEPEDIESRTLIDTVNVSVPKMMELFNDNKLIGNKYSLRGANCQSLIKDILKELRIGQKLQIINDTFNSTPKEKPDNTSSNIQPKIQPEIWIYTKKVDRFTSFKSDFLSSSEYKSGKRDDIMKSSVPVFKHWILVVKFQSTTFWMDANEEDGILRARFLDGEPENVDGRVFLGSVDLSVKEMYRLYKKNNQKLDGSKYSLSGANCQKWALGMITELGLEELLIINDVTFGIKTGIGITTVLAGAAAIASLALRK